MSSGLAALTPTPIWSCPQLSAAQAVRGPYDGNTWSVYRSGSINEENDEDMGAEKGVCSVCYVGGSRNGLGGHGSMIF
jgi:hypothetical protein